MQSDQRTPESITDVVENGLCIGCGLCESMAPDRWQMAYTQEGRLRPVPLIEIDTEKDQEILSACPGSIARANLESTPCNDDVWGGYHRMEQVWATDSDVRFKAATGGLLTALGVYLLESGRAEFILHCEADPAAPMRTQWCISETALQVISRAGSRYGPSATLAGLQSAIDRDLPFAVITKPCDAGAIRERAKVDEALNRNLVAVLVMVCGGASDLGKSQALLDEFGIEERNVTLFRYRGYGNPGATRVETKDGHAREKTYNDLWADESGWRIQTRCKVCPDAIGDAADIAASDIWPGGGPVGEDAGFNGVITKTAIGESLYKHAVAAGLLTQGASISPREFDELQPHQVRKKRALAARLRGMLSGGSCVYRHEGLRIELLDGKDADEQQQTRLRVQSGRFRETLPSKNE